MEIPIESLAAYGSMVLAMLLALPVWPWSRSWGYANAGALAYVIAVVSINFGLGLIIT
jgi:Protein of unknown function (DUF3309)